MELFTCKWLPISSPKSLVFLCHGFSTLSLSHIQTHSNVFSSSMFFILNDGNEWIAGYGMECGNFMKGNFISH